MKNTHISIIVLAVLAGGVFLFGMERNAEAPAGDLIKTETVEMSQAEEPIPLPTVHEFTISSKNFSFTPSFITVKKGDRVKITFQNTAGFHDFKIDEYGVAAKQAQSPTTEVLEFTVDKIGSFEYYCSVGTHRQMGMKGTLVVE